MLPWHGGYNRRKRAWWSSFLKSEASIIGTNGARNGQGITHTEQGMPMVGHQYVTAKQESQLSPGLHEGVEDQGIFVGF